MKGKPQIEKMKPARDVQEMHRQIRLDERGARRKAVRKAVARKKRDGTWR